MRTVLGVEITPLPGNSYRDDGDRIPNYSEVTGAGNLVWEEGTALEMCRRAFPPQVPTQRFNVHKLAQLNATGASIRNITLITTFLAVVAGEPVNMYHYIRRYPSGNEQNW